MRPADAYNQTLLRYRQQYLLFLLQSEVKWQQRMQRAADEAQAIILEHSDGGTIVRRQELNRRLRMLSQALAADLEAHLRENMTTAALLAAQGTSEAHRVFYALAKGGDRQ